MHTTDGSTFIQQPEITNTHMLFTLCLKVFDFDKPNHRNLLKSIYIVHISFPILPSLVYCGFLIQVILSSSHLFSLKQTFPKQSIAT